MVHYVVCWRCDQLSYFIENMGHILFKWVWYILFCFHSTTQIVWRYNLYSVYKIQNQLTCVLYSSITSCRFGCLYGNSQFNHVRTRWQSVYEKYREIIWKKPQVWYNQIAAKWISIQASITYQVAVDTYMYTSIIYSLICTTFDLILFNFNSMFLNFLMLHQSLAYI